jgi:hypothetical protein
LSVLDNNLPGVVFNDVLTTVSRFGKLFELTGSGRVYANPGSALSAGFSDDVTATVNVDVVPEPGSLLVWGGLMGLGLVVAARRRRA